MAILARVRCDDFSLLFGVRTQNDDLLHVSTLKVRATRKANENMLIIV